MLIRRFKPEDAAAVSVLARETFLRCCGEDYFKPGAVQHVLDSWDCDKNPGFIDDMLRTDIFFVSEDSEGRITGLVRGTAGKLNSLFVGIDCHRQGIGGMLTGCFEQEARKQGSTEVRLNSSLFAAGFYESMGYKKESGVIEFEGLKVYPMIKII